jgi:hypothetical protein
MEEQSSGEFASADAAAGAQAEAIPAGLRPASRLNQNTADSGIPSRFNLDTVRSREGDAREKHGPPMTLGNMRSNGVHTVIATCQACVTKQVQTWTLCPSNRGPGDRPSTPVWPG